MFPYYYKGGEIHALKYGSFGADEAAALAVMQAEEAFVAQPNRRLRIWVDFYETRLTETVLQAFVDSIKRLRPHIIKLAIVGCSSGARRRLQPMGKKPDGGVPGPIEFFDDPEDAKTWLVAEWV